MTDFVQVPRETLQAAVDELSFYKACYGALNRTAPLIQKLQALLDAPMAEQGTYDPAIYGDRRKQVEPLNFLADGTRFKLNFDKKGKVEVF
jgi:hypothetical protein